jgi:transposase InsO family protein
MRYTQAEKYETILMVEDSSMSVKRTLKELDIARSTFYKWYNDYLVDGYNGLQDRSTQPRRFWNKIPDHERERVKDIALDQLEKSPRELAHHITDTQGYFISESSVYRILKSYDLITSPAYIILKAADSFHTKTTRPNEMWQTDFTYFKIIGWGWFFLSTVLDDYSRYILSWKLYSTMTARDVTDTLDMALEKTGLTKVKVKHKPRLLSDNGPCYLSKELKEYLEDNDMTHTRGRPYHPQTQGKIERYHQTMKNVVKLHYYYSPEELERALESFVYQYNNHRYHESLNNVTPADMYHGKQRQILSQREKIKRWTLQERKRYNLVICTA